MLEVYLLGQFHIAVDGQPVEIPSRPAQSLLAYLALTAGVAHRREKLAGLLWPDLPEGDARRNLRRALWNIRKAAGSQAPLRADDITIAWNTRPDLWVDAQVVSSKATGGWTEAELTRVISAYGGELLPGFYDEWIIIERERLQSVFENRIKLLIDLALKAENWEAVLEWAEHWIALAPAPEPAYRALMTAYAGLGHTSGITRAYQRCGEALRRDLGMEPSEETRQLYTTLSNSIQSTAAPALRPPAAKGPPERKPAVLPRGIQPEKAPPESTGSTEDTSILSAEPPYQGMQFFDEQDAGRFYGREQLTARLVDRLGLGQPNLAEEGNLLIIVGASGSGKSSLARAGLASAVRKITCLENYLADRPRSWDIRVLTPSTHPLEALAASLTYKIESVTAAATLADDMARDTRSLRLFLRKIESPLVLIIDQLEEIFTLCRSETERRAFIDNLITASEGADCKVIFALRADFYPHCDRFESLRAALVTRQEYIGPMTRVELRRAIEEPARNGGYLFEEGLVDLILQDAGSEPGSLPLLSHALLETWKRRRGRILTLAGYAEAGGVRGAIAHTAESVYARMTPAQQKITRAIFIRLTELGEGVQDTRRSVTTPELIPPAEERACVEEVLNRLAEARLITIDAGRVEVAHEALIREWPTLRAWLSEDRDGLRLHRRLSEAARHWEELENEPGELYRGARLAQAAEWAAVHPDELTGLEHEFLAVSQAQIEQEANEREAARQREIEAAQRIAQAEQLHAAEQSRTAVRFAWLASALAVLFLAAVVLASFVLQQQNQVKHQNRLATSRELAASAITNIEDDPQRSILLALQALQTATTQEAVDALHQSVQASRVLRIFQARNKSVTRIVANAEGELAATSVDLKSGPITEVWSQKSSQPLFSLPGELAADFWPDSRQLATLNPAGSVSGLTLWDATTGKELSTVRLDFALPAALEVNLSPDWNRLATALSDGTTCVYDITSGARLLTIGHPGGPPSRSLAFFPDGKSLVTTVDHVTRLYDLASGQAVYTLPSSSNGTDALRFDPYRNRLAIGMGTTIQLADDRTGAESIALFGRSGYLSGIDYSKDGAFLAAGGTDGRAIVWDAATGQVQMVLAGHLGRVTDVAIVPYQYLLATASDDGTLRLWDVSPSGNNEGTAFSSDVQKPFTAIAFSSDGIRLAIAGGGQAGQIYDVVSASRLLSLYGDTFGSSLGSIAFSPDGSRLATTNGEATTTLWDTRSGQKLLTLPGHQDWVGSLAFSADGRRLATIGYDGLLILWDPVSGQELRSIQAFSDRVQPTQRIDLAFSPDGTRIAAAGGYQVTEWETRTGQALLALPLQAGMVNAVAFSPDGQRLAVGASDASGVWGATTGQKITGLQGLQGSITRILFDHEGSQLITSSADGSVKLWDASSGQELLTLTRQSAQITGIALSPDGNRLAVSSSDGTARVYFLRNEDLVQYALAHLNRWFTPDECQKYLHLETCPGKP